MATSYRQILYHIIFRTEGSERTLPLEHSEELYKFIEEYRALLLESGVQIDERYFP